MSETIQERLEALAELVETLAVPEPARTVPADEDRWLEIDRQIDGQVAGRRVLVVGGEAATDAREFAARGAARVIACGLSRDPPREAEADSDPRIELRPDTWEDLDPDVHGSFDLVLCNGLVHRVTEPLTLLGRLRSMTADGGTFLIDSVMIDDPERSEYLRFVPDRYAGDPSWWFVPGRLALRWLLHTAGFEVEAEFGEREGPRDLFPVISGYLKATAS